MKKLIAVGFLFTLLISCDSKTEFQTVKIKNQYSLELPDFLSEVQNLNPSASLQYQNPLREFYTIVIDEPKTDFPNPAEINLEEYHNLLKSNLETSIDKASFSTAKDTMINGLKAKLFTASGSTQGIDIFYKFAYIESKAHFYQILTWTLLVRKDKFSKDMDKIIASFKELERKSRAK